MRRRLPRLLRWIAIYLTLTSAAAAVLLLELRPYRPSSLAGWTLFFLAAVPMMLFGEWVGAKLLKNPISAAVERGTQPSTLSWMRIGYLVLLVSIVIFLIALILSLIWRD